MGEDRPRRRPGLDVLKGAAMALVILNHAVLWPMRAGDRPSAFFYGIAFGTVAAFAASAGYLRGLRPPASDRAALARRARQLLLPWVICAPVYAMAPYVWRLVGGGSLPFGFAPVPWAREILLGGGPLWFLPVLFVSQAACTPFIRRTRSWWPAIGALALYAIVAVPASLQNVSPLELGKGTFWAMAPLYMAAFWFGLRLAQDGRPRIPARTAVMIVLATMIAGGLVTLTRALVPEARWLMWLPYAIGLVGGCVALVPAADAETVTSGWFAAMLSRAGKASLWLYVLHPALVGPAVIALDGRGGVMMAALTAAGATVVGTLIVERSRRVLLPERAA
ncbi:MAG: acyltransferase [Coriobacteriia bacterium]